MAVVICMNYLQRDLFGALAGALGSKASSSAGERHAGWRLSSLSG
jgi:hypothetical protein